MTTNENLWPSDLELETIITPVSILRTQANLLGERTRGMLVGEVKTWTKGDTIHHALDVVVPALENYRYRLLKVHHSMALYPVFVDEEPTRHGPSPVKGLTESLNEATGLKDEDALREWLRQTLAREETKRILANLYAQATQ
jgi:hypothetical protein